MKYNLIWYGVRPDGATSEPYIMSTHDSLSSAQSKKTYVDQIHAGYSDEYRKAFGTGHIEIVITHGLTSRAS
jgi:hypothetical protein